MFVSHPERPSPSHPEGAAGDPRTFRRWYQEPTILVPLIAAVFGLAVGLLGFVQIGEGLRGLLTFESTVGHVERSEVRERYGRSSRSWEAAIDFTYAVDGRPYRSSHLTWSHARSQHPVDRYRVYGTRALAERDVAPYPVGRELTVWYDPARPALAVVEPGVPGSSIGWLLVGIAAFAVAMILFLLGRRA